MNADPDHAVTEAEGYYLIGMHKEATLALQSLAGRFITNVDTFSLALDLCLELGLWTQAWDMARSVGQYSCARQREAAGRHLLKHATILLNHGKPTEAKIMLADLLWVWKPGIAIATQDSDLATLYSPDPH